MRPGRIRSWLIARALLSAGRRADVDERPPEEPTDEEKATLTQDELDKLRQERQKHRPGVPPPYRQREVGAEARATTVVAVLLVAASVGAAGFIVFYIVFPDTQLLGLCIGISLALIGIALAVAGKKVFPREIVVEERHEFGDEEMDDEIEGIITSGFDGVSRRKVLGAAAGTAAVTVGAAAMFPLASLGPNVGARIRNTSWFTGRRVVDETGRPLRPADVPIGAVRSGFPEGGKFDELDAPLVLVRVPIDEIEVEPAAKRFMPDGVMAFSKICPHAGCAVSIYRHPLYEPTEPRPALVCPCHYSTFDVRRGGEVLFGPAGRDLPSLPLALNDAGELIAADGFAERIGPSYGGVRKDPDGQPLDRNEG